MDMPRPNEAHARLNALAGHWTGTEIMHPSPWSPEGGEAKGIIENRIDLDGFVLIQDYRQENGDVVTFRGHGVVHYDAEASEYVMHWWDAMGMEPNVFRGRFDGDTLVLRSQNPMGHTRASWKILGDDGYSWTFEGSQDGENWGTLMEGTYQRSS